jgi:hypothetical protein
MENKVVDQDGDKCFLCSNLYDTYFQKEKVGSEIDVHSPITPWSHQCPVSNSV